MYMFRKETESLQRTDNINTATASLNHFSFLPFKLAEHVAKCEFILGMRDTPIV